MTFTETINELSEICMLPPFADYALEGQERWQLSDGTEVLYDNLIHALSMILDTIVYCPF